MTNYFKPSDIKTVSCIIESTSRGGSGFAVSESDDKVYISPRIMESLNLDVGDSLTAYCIDTSLEEHGGGQFSARFRCIRARVEARLIDVAHPTQAYQEKPVEAPLLPPLATMQDIEQVVKKCIDRPRCWTVGQIMDEVKASLAAKRLPDGAEAKLHGWMDFMVEGGALAKVVISSGTNIVSTFYAKDADVPVSLIDEYEINE